MCAKDPDYFSKLSDASIHSLKLQGGSMSKEEATKFEKNPNLDPIIKVRYFDDAGKEEGMKTPDFDYFISMIERVVENHANPINP